MSACQNRIHARPPQRRGAALLAVLFASCLAGFPLAAQHGAPAAKPSGPFVSVDLAQHLEIKSLKHAMPPQIRGESVLFSFQESDLPKGPEHYDAVRKSSSVSDLQVRKVEIAFAHEHYRVLHLMTKTNLPEAAAHEPANPDAPLRWKEAEHDPGPPVFYYYWSPDAETLKELLAAGALIEYRLVVDGIWMADPQNPQSTRKMNGAMVSWLEPGQLKPPKVTSPEIVGSHAASAASLVRLQPEKATLAALASRRQARTVIVRYLGPPGLEVFVAGSFNQFDPWLNQLRSTSQDPRNPSQVVYEAELRLLSGQYQYHFVINGASYLDRLNPKYVSDAQGTKYSQILVP